MCDHREEEFLTAVPESAQLFLFNVTQTKPVQVTTQLGVACDSLVFSDRLLVVAGSQLLDV